MTSKSYYVFITAMVAALSGILFGYDTGVISGAVLFIQKEFVLTAKMNGFVVGSVLIGACIGALLGGRLTDNFGRKAMLIFDALLFIIGTIVTACALSITILIVGRMAVGVAIGIASFTAPLYISEIAPKRHRGALVSLNQLAIATGIFISYLVDYHFSHTESWRWMFGAGIVPAGMLLFGMLFLPDSPRWVAKQGNFGKAFSILHDLRLCPKLAEAELGEIIDTTKEKKNSWRELFHFRIRPTIWIGSGLCIIQQITGINTILYYAPTIFQMSGFVDASSAIFASIAIGIVFLVFSLVGLLLVDKLGRKPLLYIGITLMCLALVSIASVFHMNTALFSVRMILLGSTLVYVMAFAVSLGPIPWLMIAEIFPTRVRGFGASIATFFNWASNGLVAITFLTCIEFFGKSNTFLLYAAACVLSMLFIFFYVPETKQCSLEKLEKDLMAGKKMRHLGKH
ncbi:MAG: MFS transporter [Gammaproteobacteria bacterium RIFCSPHIGHO2_12_FULL_42_13]|nr:MAG: MFS transporter [Gammaproteobacteria bacterium RIFCSPHIGHO2_12_FULL_42_13]